MIQRFFVVALVTFFLNGCGGGGGGGSGTPTGGGTEPPAKGDFTISTDAVNIEGTVGTGVGSVQITGNLANPDSDVFISVDATGSTLITGASVQINGNSGILTLTPNNPAELPVGTHTGSVMVKACRNTSCTSQYSGSPKKINVTYKVNGISYEATPNDIELKMTAHHAFPTPVVVNLTTEKNVGYYGSTWTMLPDEDWLKVDSNWLGTTGTATFSIKKEMPAGTYKRNAELFAFGKAFKKIISVTYTVLPEPFSPSTKEMSFTISSESQLPSLKNNLTINSNLSTELDWTLSSNVDWLDLSVAAGNTTNKTAVQVAVNANYKNLPNGLSTATVMIQDKDKNYEPTPVNISLYVIDTGTPVTDAVANEFPINITSTAIDTAHGKLYLLESDTKKLFRVDIATGITEKYYSFDKTPEKLALSPDNQKLYITVLEKNDHDPFWFENQKGYVAILDTETESIQKTLDLVLDPYGIAITSTGKLLISGGSGQWTSLQSYNASTGTKLGTMSDPVFQKQDIFLDKQGNNVYIMDFNTLQKIDVSQPTPTLVKALTINSINLAYPAYPTPDGKYLITRSGELVSTDNLSIGKSIFSSELMRAQSLWFDEINNRVIILVMELNSSAVSVESYNLVDFQRTILKPEGFIDSQSGSYQKPYAIWLYGGKMYYLYPTADGGFKLSSSNL